VVRAGAADEEDVAVSLLSLRLLVVNGWYVFG
jgi:hypothetical protein